MRLNKLMSRLRFVLPFMATILVSVKCDQYKIGVGIGDMTGPAADINMMGYAHMGQDSHGIHFRLYSRSAIIEDTDGNRVCFVSVDIGMISQLVKLEVVKTLEEKYPGIYTKNNIMISSTHTHSGPGGFLQYVLYIVTTQGFIHQNFEVIRDGIVRSIDRAHQNMKVGKIQMNSGELLDTSINRSPTAYANNTKAERQRYEYNTDKSITVLKLSDQSGKALGAITWHAVHATSMNNTNKLISGDNKGYASMLFEQSVNGGTLHGKGPFVALYPQANEGDASPNIKGPHCLDTGLPCDFATSTCNGKNELCVAFGPGKDMFESTQIIGERQFKKAKELFDSASVELKGNIKYIHQTIDMSNTEVELADKTKVKTCASAMGHSFAAGTTDGPGEFDFKQGEKQGSPFWNVVRTLISPPSPELIECQKPKPILLATGQMKLPYPWQPNILPTQIFRIGQLLIVALPGEFTTMSGRRIREAIKAEYEKQSGTSVEVVLSGLSNAYSSYVTTYEEYQVQRYEGASTAFGPHTQLAYQQQYVKLAQLLAKGQSAPPGPDEPNYKNNQISLKPGVIFDNPPPGKKFGDVIEDAKTSYKTGSRVEVTFVSGCPRNDLKTESTFMAVEKMNDKSEWDVVATDANWETRFYWERTNEVTGESKAIMTWDIPINTSKGKYRIRHFGNSKSVIQVVTSYIGTSRTFEVI